MVVSHYASHFSSSQKPVQLCGPSSHASESLQNHREWCTWAYNDNNIPKVVSNIKRKVSRHPVHFSQVQYLRLHADTQAIIRLLIMIFSPISSYFLLLLFIPLALQHFVRFDFLNHVTPRLPTQRQFYLIFHIHHLQIATHIIQSSYSWSFCPSTPHWLPFSNFLFIILKEPIICMWPNKMILRALINLTMSAPLIRRSRYALLRILHVLSPVRIGSNILFKIRLQNKWGTFFIKFVDNPP